MSANKTTKPRPASKAKDKPGASSSPSPADRSLAVLALLAREGRALPLAEVAAQLGIPKTSAHRLCTQLVDNGYLARDIDQRVYRIGPALRALAFDALNHSVERAQRHAILDDLVREVGETCNFTTLDGNRILYLDRVEAHWPLRLSLEVGSHVPLHCTASGKLFLALLDEPSRLKLIDTLRLERLTRNTLTRREALLKECHAIAQQGHATDREEFMAGLVAVAVPVQDRSGRMRAAIAVHGPTARMSLDDALARLPALKAAARRMGKLL